MTEIPLIYVKDAALLVIRIILGITMIYYGWFKIKDMKANAKSFDKMGFRPGSFWGTIVMVIEFFGGIFILLGFYWGLAAALISLEMVTGAIWKITKTEKPFTDWSYDLLILSSALAIMTFGPGKYSLAAII